MRERGIGLDRSPSNDVPDEFISELCARVLHSLSRSDQRKNGEQYVRGLLATTGRKSIRNIAQFLGGGPARQRLHHFISSSTWQWEPVRRSLAHYLELIVDPEVWVVRPMLIPKTGRHSVGVERRFAPTCQRTVNSQMIYGVWLAGHETSIPVNWSIALSGDWLKDIARRRKVQIPDDAREIRLAEFAYGPVAEMVREWRLRRRPLVMDISNPDSIMLIRRLVMLEIPFLVRVSQSTRVMTKDPSTVYRGQPVMAGRLVEAAMSLRRPVEWFDSTEDRVRQAFFAAMPVQVSEIPTGARPVNGGQDLVLLAEWDDPQGSARLWLSNMHDVAGGALLRCTRFVPRIDQASRHMADQVGICDFEGRSFPGWHRHATLAAVAYSAAVLCDKGIDVL